MLEDLYLTSRIDQSWEYSGLDSIEECINKKWFTSYPHKITYNYNSRGFRDEEWPTNLKNSVWCIGDSFTAGLGSPIKHTWPYILQNRINQRTINLGMDGASNDWMARRCTNIIEDVNPDTIVICWSYTHRRELPVEVVLPDALNLYLHDFLNFYKNIKADNWPAIKNIDEYGNLPLAIRKEIYNLTKKTFKFTDNYMLSFENIPVDEQRRLYYTDSENITNWKNFENCITQIEKNKKNTNIIHCTIPDFCNDEYEDKCLKLLQQFQYVGKLKIVDYARDGFHFDIKTATYLVNKIQKFI